MAQEKELRSQLSVLTDELKRTNQQMQVILEKWNLAQSNRFERSSEKIEYDTVTGHFHPYRKELLEQLGPGYRRLKDEVYQRLKFHSSSFEVKEYHICVYVSADEKKLVKAKLHQVNLFRNSIAAPSLLAGILNYKYVNALPVHRLAQDFKRKW